MSKEKNIENAKAVFTKNPQMRELFFTDDGQAFPAIGPAKSHQKELGAKPETIHKVKNGKAPAADVLIEDTVSFNDDEKENEVIDAGGDEVKDDAATEATEEVKKKKGLFGK